MTAPLKDLAQSQLEVMYCNVILFKNIGKHYHFPFLVLSFSLSFLCFSHRPITPSAPTPPNTKATPTHCPKLNRCPNHTTLSSIVSIFLVTVIVTSKRLENLLNV